MATKIFIAYSYQDRNRFRDFDKKLRFFLEKECGSKTHAFVFDFKKKVSNKKLMKESFALISRCDLIIAELSHKSIGVGIEVGFAKAKGKKIIYVHKKRTPLSTTVDGIADIRIEYNNIKDLLEEFKHNSEIKNILTSR